jgi:hypothetical protein
MKISSGMGLPMLREIQRHKVSSHPFPPPSQYLRLHKKAVLEIGERYKCTQPIGEIFSTPPFPFVVGVDS